MSDIRPPLKKQKIGLNDILSDSSPWKQNHCNGSANENLHMPNLIWKQYIHQKIVPDSSKSFIPPKYLDDRTIANHIKYPVIDISKSINHPCNIGENCSAAVNITDPLRTLSSKRIKLQEVGCNGDGPQTEAKFSPHHLNHHSATPFNACSTQNKPIVAKSTNSSLTENSIVETETEAAVNSVLVVNDLDAEDFGFISENRFPLQTFNVNNTCTNDTSGFCDSSNGTAYKLPESDSTSIKEIPLSKLFPLTDKNKTEKTDSDNCYAVLNRSFGDTTSLVNVNCKRSNTLDTSSKFLNNNHSHISILKTHKTDYADDSSVNNKSDLISATSSLSEENNDLSDDTMLSRDHVDLTKSCVNPKLVGVVQKISKYFEDSEFRRKVEDATKLEISENEASSSKYDILSRKLVLLLHAFSCLITCLLPNCTVIKRLWRHMISCCDKTCTAAMCKTSCQILCHFSDCVAGTCAVCARVKPSNINAKLYGCQGKNLNSKVINDSKFPESFVASSLHLTLRSNSLLKCDEINGKIPVAENLVINSNMKPVKEKIWKPEDLDNFLRPLLNLLFGCKKEIEPFMRPVDPDLDGCADYFDIIKHPMDFSTLLKNLSNGVYAEPWSVLDDIYLIFSNAWLYNKRYSYYHKYACKLADIFEANVDRVMKSLGFCCGQRYEFTPLPKYCDSQLWCVIPVMTDYYSLRDQYSFCDKCFTENRCPTVSIFKDLTSEPVIVPKELFVRKRNHDRKSERFVRCSNCGRKNHVICVQFLEEVHTSYVCDYCVKKGHAPCKQVLYRAKDIAETKLSAFIERRVHLYLSRKKQFNSATKIYVRQIAGSRSVTEVRPRFHGHFADMPSAFAYTAKALFVFQEREEEAEDVCFFGMHTQEYGSDAPQPNQRRVYLAYLDSIQYFEPAAYRTAVYHEILLAYMQYIKSLGFIALHVWSCPPSEGDDYIFNCHPPKQKIPKTKRLHEWYCRLLDKAQKENIVSRYSDILSYAVTNELKSATDMPYFEGDFWPTSLEDNIKILEKNDNSSEKAVGGKSGQLKGTKPKKGQKQHGKGKKMMNPIHGDALVDKIYSTLGKYREMFFVVEFFNNANNIVVNQPLIKDPDPLIFNDLMNERSTFLIVAREKQAEFSTLRRAKHSTLVMLHEIMMRIGEDRSGGAAAAAAVDSIKVCVRCSSTCFDKHFQCLETCKSWIFCTKCYEAVGHEHETKVFKSETSVTRSQTAVEHLEHAANCDGCGQSTCQKFRAAIAHVAVCSVDKRECSCCHTVARLSLLHARKCLVPIGDNCTIVFCNQARTQLRLQTQQQRQFDNRLVQRRTMAMLGPQQEEEDDDDDESVNGRANNWDRMGRG